MWAINAGALCAAISEDFSEWGKSAMVVVQHAVPPDCSSPFFGQIFMLLGTGCRSPGLDKSPGVA